MGNAGVSRSVVIPCSMQVRALEKAAKVPAWEPQAGLEHLWAG